MHYNHFTINYIEAIKKHLKIELNEQGEAAFFPDAITNENINELKIELQNIWPEHQTAISIISEKKDSKLQSGLFGLVNDFANAIKIGFLISDRIVLVDYIFERILSVKEVNKIDKQHLGSIASGLVSCLPLAHQGRIVIIPSPLKWSASAKLTIKEVAEKGVIITPNLMTLLCMLSITRECQLQPYTVAESEKEYLSILNNDIKTIDVAGQDIAKYTYESVLGGLVSEKLLKEKEFKFIKNVPLAKYYEIISDNESFREKYLSQIISRSSLNAQNNIDELKKQLKVEIEKHNNALISKFSKQVTNVLTVGGGTLGLLGTAALVSATVATTGALLALSANLAGLINLNSTDSTSIISVFKKLHDETN